MLVTDLHFPAPQKLLIVPHKQTLRLDPSKLRPCYVITVSMVAAFLLFSLLDCLEQWLCTDASMAVLHHLHFVRGFLSTGAGMSIVYWVMWHKESELLKLSEHFAEQLSEATEELSMVNKLLSHEVAYRREVEENLRCSFERLAQTNASLQQFAKIASHDLQEPLRAINGYAGLLSRRYSGKLDNNADQYLQSMLDGTKRMEGLIQDILAHAECKGRHKAFERVDCNTVIDEVLQNLSVSIKESNALITKDPLPAIVGDRVQLVQLFQNLLSNAIKFHGKNNPQIHISAKTGRPNDLVFSVADNGIGIDPHYKEQIFEMFKRLHGRRSYPGTGVGLAICKTIVENHGGKIWLVSQPGKGSTFRFCIPSDPSEEKSKL